MKGQAVMLQKQLRSQRVCSQGSGPETVLCTPSLHLALSPAFHPYGGPQPPSLCLLCTGGCRLLQAGGGPPLYPSSSSQARAWPEQQPASQSLVDTISVPLGSDWTFCSQAFKSPAEVLAGLSQGPSVFSVIPENAHAKVPAKRGDSVFVLPFQDVSRPEQWVRPADKQDPGFLMPQLPHL